MRPILLALLLVGCKTTDRVNVTAPARTSIAGSVAASERSSAHIRKIRSNAEGIDFKSTKALEYFP